MEKLKPDQRQKVKDFMSFTTTKETYAIKQLTKYKWNNEAAIADYFDNPPMMDETEFVSTGKLDALFDKYKDSKDNKMGPDGFDKFCADLGVQPEDLVVLVLCWKLNSKELYVVDKTEFVQGFKAIGCDDLTSIKKRIPEFRRVLTDPKDFKLMYRFVFNIAKMNTVKVLELDTAIAMWDQLIGSKFGLMADWSEYMTTVYKKAVNKDTWNMTYDFSLKYNKPEDLKNYDQDEVVWASIFDDFVSYMKAKYPKVLA